MCILLYSDFRSVGHLCGDAGTDIEEIQEDRNYSLHVTTCDYM